MADSTVDSLASRIAANVSKGVLSGVTSVASSVEASVAQARSLSQSVFSSVADDARSSIDKIIDGLDKVTEASRNKLGSAAQGAFSGLFSGIMGIGHIFTGGLLSAVGGGGGGGGLLSVITGGFSFFMRGIGMVVRGIGGFFRLLLAPLRNLGGLGGLIQAPLNLIRTAVGFLFNQIVQGVMLVARVVMGVAQFGMGLVAAGFRAAFGVVQAIGQALAQLIGAAIRAGLNALGQYIRGVFMTAYQGARALGHSVIQAARAGLTAVMQAASAFWPLLVVIIGVVIAIMGVIYTAIMAALAFVARQLSNAIIMAFRVGAYIFNTILVPVWGLVRNMLVGAFRAGQAAYNVVGPILANVARAVAGWLRAGFAWLQSAFQWVGQMIPQVVGAIGGFVSRIVAFAPTFLSTFASIASKAWAFGVALVTLVGTMSVVMVGVKAIWESAKAAMDVAKTSNQMSSTNGMSSGENASLLQRFSVFGIGSQAVQGAFGGNSEIQNMKGSMFGLAKVGDPNFINSFADKYGKMMSQGFVGQMMATNMAKVMGLDKPEFTALSKLSPAQRQGQMNYANNINKSLGFNPSNMVAQATEVNLAVNKISYAFQQLKLKLFSIAAPFVERVATLAANALGSNAQAISGFFEMAVKWLFVDAPPLIMGAIATITSTINDAVVGIIEVGTYLVANIPTWFSAITEWLAGALQWMAETIASVGEYISGVLLNLSETTANWARAILEIGPQLTEAIAGVVESVRGALANMLITAGQFLIDFATNTENGFRSALLGILGGVDSLLNGIRSASGAFAGISAFIVSTLVNTLLSALPAGAREAAGTALGLATGIQTNPLVAFQMASAQASAQMPVSNIRGTVEQGIMNNQQQFVQFGQGLVDRGNDINAGTPEALAGIRRTGANLTNAINNGLNNVSGLTATGAERVQGMSKSASGFFMDASKTVGPMGQQIGDAVAGKIQTGVDFMKKVQPYTQSAANAASSFQKKVGTKEEREQLYLKIIADETKKSREITQEMNTAIQSNQGLGGAMSEGFSQMLGQTMSKVVRSVL